MTDSTRRALRTLYHGVVAAIVVVPALVAELPQHLLDGYPQVAAIVAAVLTGIGVVSKVINVAEDKGVIPAWLKTPPAGTDSVREIYGSLDAADPAPADAPATAPPTS